MSFVTPHNYLPIQRFVEAIHNSGDNFLHVTDPLGLEDDTVIATRDRYGISINTVYNQNTGLIRSTPYYSPEALEIFYSSFYRDIYSTTHPEANYRKSSLLAQQIKSGLRVLNDAKSFLPPHATILDFGGGIGGALLPFNEAGYDSLCLDYGVDYINYGITLGINGIVGGLSEIPGDQFFDLIILSHVLEHTLDPVFLIRQLFKRLTPQGLIYIDVPGLDWIHKVWMHDFQSHLQNAHVWYFSRATLNNVLINADCKSLRWLGHTSCFCSPECRTGFDPVQLLTPPSLARVTQYLALNRLLLHAPSNCSRLSSKVVGRLFGDI